MNPQVYRLNGHRLQIVVLVWRWKPPVGFMDITPVQSLGRSSAEDE